MGWFTRRVLICLVLGFALTVASAWLPGALIRTGAAHIVEGEGWYSRNVSVFGSQVRVRRLTAPGIDALVLDAVVVDTPRLAWIPSGAEAELDHVMSGWAQRVAWPRLRRHALEANGLYLAETRGWPVSALWCEYVRSFDRPHARILDRRAIHGALVLPGRHRTLGDDLWWLGNSRTLPYRPIWSGLAIDVGFWAAVVAPLVFTPALIRRIRRRRAGGCAACGYDLAGLAPDAPCPECGRPRKAVR